MKGIGGSVVVLLSFRADLRRGAENAVGMLIFITLTTVGPIKQAIVLGSVMLRYWVEALGPEEGVLESVFRDDFAR